MWDVVQQLQLKLIHLNQFMFWLKFGQIWFDLKSYEVSIEV